MRIEDVAGVAFDHIFGRIFRRVLLTLVVAALAVVAIYYFTAAATLALEAQYGMLDARLVIGAVYTAVAIAVAIVWSMLGKTTSTGAPALSTQRDMQIAMLVEAVMLGYALARKGARTR